MNYQYLSSPVGKLRLVSNGESLVAIEFENLQTATIEGEERIDPVLKACGDQLKEYFAGKRQHFDLPLAPTGTEFQKNVWQALTAIPFGELRSYRDIAESLEKPKAVRAVGAANGRNSLPIVVPCHRVIGSDGSLTGFAGGLDAKRVLLRLEGAIE
ncbi:MAG: methylated-DNA--[protein]-cysteine S-methyltransferase [Halieaceae bacterium]|jgi:methylated-DNA-[protein]-cysteine S-methyltransferase|uniref:Methylated-DNA--protein-cysteine methyltransferase n=1 Tax=Candidatus Seongchinamella marina TaxID=2518990 RepID=A0ABT3T1I2_9GAMM|nr:methylated-DNA--[protein]-cysteine S-methyltransferase [Candidatus Seongchinamella marina]MBT7718408.1 methylated-DNA--[protein]-cysteine S-methyltransferase [Halieaceae bacterium]MCX2975691.1 methylated-DNA--[protein]-cysteine S-methyltransferase [Candidatus Seongchinamella marina]